MFRPPSLASWAKRCSPAMANLLTVKRWLSLHRFPKILAAKSLDRPQFVEDDPVNAVRTAGGRCC